MPYIDPDARKMIDTEIEDLLEALEAFSEGQKAGVLNYTITKLLDGSYPVPKYRSYNEIVGILECAKQEYYRRKIAPYENYKKDVNGDVF